MTDPRIPSTAGGRLQEEGEEGVAGGGQGRVPNAREQQGGIIPCVSGEDVWLLLGEYIITAKVGLHLQTGMVGWLVGEGEVPARRATKK